MRTIRNSREQWTKWRRTCFMYDFALADIMTIRLNAWNKHRHKVGIRTFWFSAKIFQISLFYDCREYQIPTYLITSGCGNPGSKFLNIESPGWQSMATCKIDGNYVNIMRLTCIQQRTVKTVWPPNTLPSHLNTYIYFPPHHHQL